MKKARPVVVEVPVRLCARKHVVVGAKAPCRACERVALGVVARRRKGR